MPKSDTPATRRSARVAAASAGPASKAKASASASGANASGKGASDEAERASKVANSNADKDKDKDTDGEKGGENKAEGDGEKPKGVTSRGVLKVGQTLPPIVLEDNTGAEVDVSTLAGERGVVLFLYPRADTPGCTNQACGYRDKHDEIAELGYDIYGLSKDKPAAQQKLTYQWINKKNLNYRLLCDPQSQLIKKLGAFVQPNNTNRSHFIFEKGTGKLVDIAFRVKPADDPSNVVKFLKAHHEES